MRILFAGERWPGSDAYAYERAFRRAGHAVTAIESATFLPTGWRSPWLRAVRRLLTPALIAEYERALIDAAETEQPHLFVGFKAPFVTVRAMQAIKATGAVAINIYPDVSFMAHGPRLPQTLPLYDWIFTTKTFGIADLRGKLGITGASFFPPAFDPELHHPMPPSADETNRLGADVSFIGTWSPKKEALMAAAVRGNPGAKVRIWGGSWHRATAPELAVAIQNRVVIGPEYTKAVCASRINLGLLSEQVAGASSGDLITHRTFAMPACGGFMLHERTPEIGLYYEEGREVALFSVERELVDKVRYYLEHEDERRQVAEAGRARALASGYSVDQRAADVIAKFHDLRATLTPAAGAPS